MIAVGLSAKGNKSSIREQVEERVEGKKHGLASDNQVPKSLRSRAKRLLR